MPRIRQRSRSQSYSPPPSPPPPQDPVERTVSSLYAFHKRREALTANPAFPRRPKKRFTNDLSNSWIASYFDIRSGQYRASLANIRLTYHVLIIDIVLIYRSHDDQRYIPFDPESYKPPVTPPKDESNYFYINMRRESPACRSCIVPTIMS